MLKVTTDVIRIDNTCQSREMSPFSKTMASEGKADEVAEQSLPRKKGSSKGLSRKN